MQISQLNDTIYTAQLTNGQYYWKVKAYTSQSSFTFSNVLSFVIDTPTEMYDKENLPTEFYLSQNYPNPFNPNTVFSYQLPVSSDVTLKVYDVLGNEVVTLVNEYKSAGEYEVEFTASDGIRDLPAGRQGLVSGIYFYQLRAGEFIQAKKMTLIK